MSSETQASQIHDLEMVMVGLKLQEAAGSKEWNTGLAVRLLGWDKMGK